MRTRGQRGAVSLFFVVAMTVSVVTLIMLLNARTVTTVTMVNRYEISEQAMLQAESVMAMTRAKISLNRDFGKNGETVVLGTKVPVDENGTWAEVSFAPGAAHRSQNNLGEPTQKFGEGGLVLNSNMCQIVAESHYRSKTVIAYCIVTGPPLPYSLGAAGKLRTGGNTLIGGVENAAALADGLQDDDLVEGGVVANGIAKPPKEGEVPQPPMVLESGVKVVGNAQSAGAIEDHGAVIEKGEKKPFADKQELPKISIADYDPKDREGVVSRTEAVVTTGGPIYGFQRFGQSVTFKEEVDLNGALLFVDGDVTLEKPLKGTGALVATGKVTLLGGANMKADSLAAVLAGDDLTINGSRSGNAIASNFMGLLYTEGNLSLSNTRTVGAAVAGGVDSEGEGSTMTIQDSEVLSAPEGLDVAIAIQDFATPGAVGKGAGRAAEAGSNDLNDVIIKPAAADLFVNGEFRTDRSFIESLVKIRYKGITYDSLQDLPPDAPANLQISHMRAVNDLVKLAEALKAQHENKPVEIVRFDLNEFLNISDRLRSTRTFYIEG